MSIRKKHIICYYTIVEVMVAMGIFLVMMTIMMQFFTSAQKVWNAASKKNMMYADARVAMNLMTRELQSMLYDDELDTGTYPFWFEWTDIDNDHDDGVARTSEFKKYFSDNNDFTKDTAGNQYLTTLNFISTTDLKPVDQGSDVCEVRYKFIPVYFKTSSPTSMNDVKGGTLKRSCIGEWQNTTTQTPVADYNFNTYPNNEAHTPTDRVEKIWEDYTPTIFDTVINGIYSLRFSCYIWDSGLKLIKPLDINNDLKDNGGFAASGTLATGSPAPVAIRIDMKLMAPKDLKKLAYNIYVTQNGSSSEKKGAEKQIRVLKQKMRTFSKVIYLGKREN